MVPGLHQGCEPSLGRQHSAVCIIGTLSPSYHPHHYKQVLLKYASIKKLLQDYLTMKNVQKNRWNDCTATFNCNIK